MYLPAHLYVLIKYFYSYQEACCLEIIDVVYFTIFFSTLLTILIISLVVQIQQQNKPIVVQILWPDIEPSLMLNACLKI